MNRISTVIAGSLLGSVVLAGWATGGIEGSKHDFSQDERAKGDACAPCHAPRRDKPSAVPLWDPAANLTRTFGTSLNEPKRAGQGTLICLRCHDGTVARDFVPVASYQRFVNKQNPRLFRATGHGTTDHPVGIDYPQFDKGFQPMAQVAARGTVLLPGGRVECTSCHDPHNQSGWDKFLVTSNAGSALCLTCHRK